MKSLFIVGAKLVGLVFLYEASTTFNSLLLFFNGDFVDWWHEVNESSWVGTLILQLVFGLLLTFKAGWVARVIRIENTEQSLNLTIDSKELLSIGIRLVGLFLLLQRLLGFNLFMINRIAGFASAHYFEILRDIVLIWIYLLPLYLIFGWRRVTDILVRVPKNNRDEKFAEGSLRNLRPKPPAT